ncbi:type 12 methyltransferase [Tritrichomonas foetus]|uniref:Type 12 methyltransferase n=1 Tax=Tritrichomonas foetus TaxID=1144522 RepID=A0A1J4JMT7_9EUKA|nr:type 12 methyltransferase [Tritrichomonas foetus]|eukprot:OHS98861.1 type 12 methyltransferase [Tritrichomonas foetus]
MHPRKSYDTPERIEACKIFAGMIKENVKLTPETVILDFGAGTGLVGIPLLPHVKKIIFEDISEHMLAKCQENLDKQENKNYEILLSDVKDYNGEKADIVIASMVYHHFEDIEAMTKTLLSKMKPHGILIICDFLPGAAFFERMKPNIPNYGFVPDDLGKKLLESGCVKYEVKPANTISHIQDDGQPEYYERFSIYAEAP